MSTFIMGKNDRDESRQYVSISDGDSGVVSLTVSAYADHALIFLDPKQAKAVARALIFAAKKAEEEQELESVE